MGQRAIPIRFFCYLAVAVGVSLLLFSVILNGSFGFLQASLMLVALLMVAVGGFALWVYQKDLRRLAVTDSLTGLANRMLLHERLHQAVTDSRNRGLLSMIVLIDLDRFKEINDCFGHFQGDFVLREVAERLIRATRDTDTVSRIGGDEFAVVIPGLDSVSDGEFITQQIRKELAKPLLLSGVSLQVHASIGIVVAPLEGDDVEALLRKADAAMYCAKGRDHLIGGKKLATVI